MYPDVEQHRIETNHHVENMIEDDLDELCEIDSLIGDDLADVSMHVHPGDENLSGY